MIIAIPALTLNVNFAVGLCGVPTRLPLCDALRQRFFEARITSLHSTSIDVYTGAHGLRAFSSMQGFRVTTHHLLHETIDLE